MAMAIQYNNNGIYYVEKTMNKYLRKTQER